MLFYLLKSCFNSHTQPWANGASCNKRGYCMGSAPAVWNWSPELLSKLQFKHNDWFSTWPRVQTTLKRSNRPFSHCIDQAGLGAFTAKSGRKHYNPPPLTVMWMNFDSPNFPSFCSLSAIISFQTCSNKCILYVLSFHKCIKIKYKMVNMYGVFRD